MVLAVDANLTLTLFSQENAHVTVYVSTPTSSLTLLRRPSEIADLHSRVSLSS